MLISIIIPVYNVEKHIEKCIQSLLDQSYKNFQAIIVDDGSPDNSISIAKKLVKNDSRFIFLEQKNSGQGVARNQGLDHAKGDFIAFLDSDDSFTTDMLQTVYSELSRDPSIDVLTFGHNKVDEAGRLLLAVNRSERYFDTQEDLLLFIRNNAVRYMWDKVFKRTAFNNLRFDSEIRTYEDQDLVYKVLYGKQAKSINKNLYNYTQRANSTIHRVPPSYIADKTRITYKAKKFLKEKGLLEQNNDYYIAYYLDEMFLQPALLFSRFSENYENDLKDLLSQCDTKLLSFKNIYKYKHFKGNAKALTLLAFKTNKSLFPLFVKSRDLLKNFKHRKYSTPYT